MPSLSPRSSIHKSGYKRSADCYTPAPESSELAQMILIENEPHMQSQHVHWASADMLQLVSGTQVDEVYPDVVNIVVSYTEYVFPPEAFAANPQVFWR